MNTHSIELDGYYARSRGNSTIYLGTAGSHGNEQLQVTQGKGWEGLTVQVVFHPCKVAVQLPANGVLDVPWEATARPLTAMQGRIVFQGFDQDRLVNSTDLAYSVASHSPTLGRDEEPYTPGIVEGVLNQMAADKDAILQAAQQTGQAKEAAAASAAAAASSAANAQQSAGAANTSAGQAADSASQAAGSAAAANETLTQVQTAGQEAQQKVKDAETEALGNISAAAPALPAVSAAAAWQSATVKPDGTGYNLAAMAPIEATIRPTVTGNPAVCEDSVAWGFQGLKVYGKSTQDGTPSPENPVPITSAGDGGSVKTEVTGGNLIRTHGSETINGVTFTDNRDGTITVNGTASSDAIYYLTSRDRPFGFNRKNTSYFLSGCPSGGSSSKYRIQWWNYDGLNNFAYDYGDGVAVDCSDVTTNYNICINVKKSTVVNNVVFKPMLNYEAKAMPFEPYKGLQKITISTLNGLPGIPVEYGGNFVADGQQLVCDVKDYGTGKYTQNCKKAVFDGSDDENWRAGVTYFPDKFRCICDAPQLAKVGVNNMAVAPVLCDKFNATSAGNESSGTFGGQQGVAISSSGTLMFYSDDFNSSDISAWKNWLKTNPIEVVYQVETPIETDIPAEELAAYRALQTYTGTTVVSTAEPVAGIEARYVMDGNKYRESVDKRLAALEAAQTGI